jgi:hypothetical protein
MAMTPIRKHALIKRVKDITLSTTLSLALLNGSVLLQGCGSNDNNDRDRTEQVESFRKGVRTFITETSPGQFKITDEVEAEPDKAGAIVRYYDGHSDTLGVEAARRLVQNDPSTQRYMNNPNSYQGHHSNGLANVLLWGGLGYMMGRSMSPQYRQDQQRYGSGVYSNPGVYSRSQRVGESVRSSRVVSSRPSGGRGGFFGGRSRGASS